LFAGMFLAFADAIRNFTRALEQLVVKTAARLSKQRTVKLNLKICSSQAFFMSFRTPARLQEGHVSVVELPNYMFFATAPGIVATIRRALLEASVVILDWEKVRGLDTKATLEFAQLCCQEDEMDSLPRGILTFAAMPPSIRQQLVAARVLPPILSEVGSSLELAELPETASGRNGRRPTATSDGGAPRRSSQLARGRLSGVTALRGSIVLPSGSTGAWPHEARSLSEALAAARGR
ncbi:YGR125W, partial [Symbiodinium pilosum]